MFVLFAILAVIVLISIYKFSDKFLIPLITRKLNASPEEASSLYDEASVIAREADNDASKELKEASEKKKATEKLISKKFKK